MSDPRVFFAAERTLLAWMRSGLTVIALGFVVARFNLFLAAVSLSSPQAHAAPANHWAANALGIVLVLFGAGTVLAALHNHRRYVASLPRADVPTMAMPWLSAFLCLSVGVLGFLLAAYLALA